MQSIRMTRARCFTWAWRCLRSRQYDEAAKHFVRILELDLGKAACVRWVYDALISHGAIDGKAGGGSVVREAGPGLSFPMMSIC